MKINIDAEPKEIAALVVALQERQKSDPTLEQYLKERKNALEMIQSHENRPSCDKYGIPNGCSKHIGHITR